MLEPLDVLLDLKLEKAIGKNDYPAIREMFTVLYSKMFFLEEAMADIENLVLEQKRETVLSVNIRNVLDDLETRLS